MYNRFAEDNHTRERAGPVEAEHLLEGGTVEGMLLAAANNLDYLAAERNCLHWGDSRSPGRTRLLEQPVDWVLG